MLNASEIMELQKLSGMDKFSKLTLKQMFDRERLIGILIEKPIASTFEQAADFLIANDVVPVVRCKNCDWYREDGSICVNPHCGKSFYGCRVRQDHFCSYGERREGE